MEYDYEKRYKEALKVIEGLYDIVKYQSSSDALLTCQTIERAFPELLESEDERIRKAIKEAVENYWSDDTQALTDILAWLEKQGNQESLCDKCRKEQPSHSCQDITALGRCALEKQGEQKSSWSEEDEKIYQSIIDDTVQENQLDGNQITWIKFLKNRVQSQPKQEWSESNIDYSLEVIGFLKNYIKAHGCTAMNGWVNWLENIKDRVQPQPKQEWSVEDEKRVNSIVSSIEYCSDQYQDRKEYAKDIDWINSLKGRVKPQPTPELSEYDNKMIKNIEDSLYVYSESHPCLKVVVDEELEWLKSLLKERVLPKSTQEWSEEDKLVLKQAIYVCHQNGYTAVEDWLKSLKPNHWKPSEQNIKDLEWCADLIKDKMGVGFHRLQVFINEIKQL